MTTGAIEQDSRRLTHVEIEFGDESLAIPVGLLVDLFRQNMPPALADPKSEEARKQAPLLAAATALIRPLYRRWLVALFGPDLPEKPKDQELIPWLIRLFVAIAITKMAAEPIKLETETNGHRHVVMGITPPTETKAP
jgi:hypothetical protein